MALTRKKTNTPEEVNQKPLWKKITPGTLYPFPDKRNKRVKPSEQIYATAAELGKFVKQFQLIKDGTGIYRTKPAETKPATAGPAGTKAKPGTPKADKPVKSTKPAKSETTPKETYSLQKNEVTGGFNVISPAGKVMNDEELIEESAAALKEKLEKDSAE